jgi:hypothetical protein
MSWLVRARPCCLDCLLLQEQGSANPLESYCTFSLHQLPGIEQRERKQC